MHAKLADDVLITSTLQCVTDRLWPRQCCFWRTRTVNAGAITACSYTSGQTSNL